MPLSTPKKVTNRTEATFKRLGTAMVDMELPAMASMTEFIEAGKTLDRLLAAKSIDVEEVVTDFKAVRKLTNARKKPTAPAA